MSSNMEAQVPIVHFAYHGGPACGRSSSAITIAPGVVNCGSCNRTAAFREAKERVDGQNLAGLQALLDVIGKAGHAWANEEGHCDAYDQGVAELNMAIARAYPGAGLAIAERKQKFMLRIRHEEIEADDEDEALEIIARNIRTWVQVS